MKYNGATRRGEAPPSNTRRSISGKAIGIGRSTLASPVKSDQPMYRLTLTGQRSSPNHGTDSLPSRNTLKQVIEKKEEMAVSIIRKADLSQELAGFA